MPQAYVQTLFDQYAPRFESSLVDDLGYRGPALLFKAVLSVRSAARKPALLQARHRSRLRHRACGGGLRQRSRSFHRRRSVAAHDRAGARHRPLCRAGSRRHAAGSARAGRTPAPISFSPRMPWSMSPISRRFSPRPAACWRPAGCSPSPPKPMAAKASSSARGCAMPMRAAYVRAAVECRRPQIVPAGRSLRPQRGQCAGAGPRRGRRENLSLDATRLHEWRHCVRHVSYCH